MKTKTELYNRITEIILDGAPSNTTIAQIKLMAANLAALVDKSADKFISVSVLPSDEWTMLDEATNATPSRDAQSINGAEINSPKSHMTAVAMADGLYRAENGKLAKIGAKPDLYKDDNCKIKGDDDAGFTYAVYHPPIDNNDFTPSDKHPLDPPSEASLKAMAKLGIDIEAILPETRTFQFSDGEREKREVSC